MALVWEQAARVSREAMASWDKMPDVRLPIVRDETLKVSPRVPAAYSFPQSPLRLPFTYWVGARSVRKLLMQRTNTYLLATPCPSIKHCEERWSASIFDMLYQVGCGDLQVRGSRSSWRDRRDEAGSESSSKQRLRRTRKFR